MCTQIEPQYSNASTEFFFFFFLEYLANGLHKNANYSVKVEQMNVAWLCSVMITAACDVAYSGSHVAIASRVASPKKLRGAI